MQEHRYRAFLCYSHRDSAWADWLHDALETYAIPPRLVGLATAAGTIPPHLRPVFRDRDELPSASDLSAKVRDALAQSACFIVICSPHAAQSRWVDEEVVCEQGLVTSRTPKDLPAFNAKMIEEIAEGVHAGQTV